MLSALIIDCFWQCYFGTSEKYKLNNSFDNPCFLSFHLYYTKGRSFLRVGSLFLSIPYQRFFIPGTILFRNTTDGTFVPLLNPFDRSSQVFLQCFFRLKLGRELSIHFYPVYFFSCFIGFSLSCTFNWIISLLYRSSTFYKLHKNDDLRTFLIKFYRLPSIKPHSDVLSYIYIRIVLPLDPENFTRITPLWRS